MTCDHGALEIKNDDGKVCAPARCPLNGFWDVKGENVIASLPTFIETEVMDHLGEGTEESAEMLKESEFFKEFVGPPLNSLKNAFENFLWTNNGCGPRKHGFSHECPTSLLADLETPCEKEVECDAHGQCWLPHGTVCEIPCKAGFMSISAVACIEGVLVPAVDEPFKDAKIDGDAYDSLSELLSPRDYYFPLDEGEGEGDEGEQPPPVDGRRIVQNEMLRAMGLFQGASEPHDEGEYPAGATTTFLQRIITHKGVCVPAVCDIVDLSTDEYKATIWPPAAEGRRLDADLHDRANGKLVRDYLQDRPGDWSRQDALLSGRHPLPVDIVDISGDADNKDEELILGMLLTRFGEGICLPNCRNTAISTEYGPCKTNTCDDGVGTQTFWNMSPPSCETGTQCGACGPFGRGFHPHDAEYLGCGEPKPTSCVNKIVCPHNDVHDGPLSWFVNDERWDTAVQAPLTNSLGEEGDVATLNFGAKLRSTCYLEADSSCTLDCKAGYIASGHISCDGGVLTHTAECAPMGCELSDLPNWLHAAVEDEFHPHGEHQERRARHVHSGEEATVACADPDYSLFVGDHDSKKAKCLLGQWTLPTCMPTCTVVEATTGYDHDHRRRTDAVAGGDGHAHAGSIAIKHTPEVIVSGWWKNDEEGYGEREDGSYWTLNEAQRAAAETLGWTQDTWNNQQMGRAPKAGDKDIFDQEWDDLSDGQREAAETLKYTKETWEDPTTGAIAVSNVVGVDGTPTEVHVPAGAVDFKMSFSTGGALGVQFEIFPLCGDWMRHLHTEILKKGADDKLASATPLFPDDSLTYKSTAAGTDPIKVARDSIEALYHESWGGRPGSGLFFGESDGLGPGGTPAWWEYCFGPGPHRDGPANPYGVFLDAGCQPFPYFSRSYISDDIRADRWDFLDGKEWRGRSDPQYQTICLDSDNLHGTIQVSGANSRGFGAPPPARRARPRLRNTHPAPRRRPARHQDAHPADDHATRTPPAHRGGARPQAQLGVQGDSRGGVQGGRRVQVGGGQVRHRALRHRPPRLPRDVQVRRGGGRDVRCHVRRRRRVALRRLPAA